MIANVLAYATTGPHRARAQSAVADGARARNRTLRVHGINATCVTAHKPPFHNSRIMLLISVILSITKFPPEHRVYRDGMIQSHDRSSTSTKNSQNKTMHRSGRSIALNFRNFLDGHSVMVAVRPSNTMLVTIERKRLDTHRLYGVIVNESEQLICLHREIDFQFDGYVFIRKKDVTSCTCDTPSHKYTEALMRKEGFWLKPDRFVRQLDIASWQTTVTALIGKPVMVENENRSTHNWVGIVDACTRTMATVHCFDGLGVLDDDADRIPLRSVTSIQYGDRYTQTHHKYLKNRTNQAMHRCRGSAVS